VSDPAAHVRGIAAAITAAGPAPAVSNVRWCSAAEPPETACACTPDTSPAFYEYHGQLTLPVMQAGTRPYATPELGGNIVVDGTTGLPVVQAAETVCFAATIPVTALPAAGWPIVIYAHGTGGDYRSGVQDVGESLATAGLATLSFTGVMHGERRGPTDLTPDLLFFNVTNPRAARDNVLQGAADLIQVARIVRAGIAAAPIDPAKVYFFGHSQGSTTGGLAVPFVADALDTVVLSGAGGHLTQTLLTKTSPYDLAAGMSLMLGEDIRSYRTQPVLALFQQFFDPSDLVHYGRYYFKSPWSGADATGAPITMPPRNVVQTYGVDDSFSPQKTLTAVLKALGVTAVAPLVENYDVPGCDTAAGPDGAPGTSDDCALPATVAAPVSNNVTASLPPVTGVLLQADPAGVYDGHFAAFRDASLRSRWTQFFSSKATTGTATVP
jgi:hypothetical protein